MSVYLALHTSASPDIGDIAKFGKLALELGASQDSMLAVNSSGNGALTVVIPIPEERGEVEV